MRDERKKKNQLIKELRDLRKRVADAETFQVYGNVTEASLMESERRLSTLISNLPGVVYRCFNDSEWTMKFVSDRFLEVTGFACEDIIDNRTVDFNSLIHREDQGPCWEQIQASLAKGQPYRLIYRITTRDGLEKWIWDQGVGVPSKAGEPEALEGFLIDITDKKRIEAELEKAKDLALLGEFSSAIAHQIRNPLGDILLAAKLLQKTLAPAGETKPLLQGKGKALDRMFRDFKEGIDNLNRVVTELLQYSKTLSLNPCEQRIELILRETFSQFHDLIAQTGTKIEWHFSKGLPPISVDAVLMGQVFQNIVYNAIQAMPNGGLLDIKVGISNQIKNHIGISVSDTGIGIDPSKKDKIFHPFYTTKDRGIGLGLSLAHRIIEAHRGRISVHRNPTNSFFEEPASESLGRPTALTKGTTIHILLPID